MCYKHKRNSYFLALATNATVAVTAPMTPTVVSSNAVTVFTAIMVAAVVYGSWRDWLDRVVNGHLKTNLEPCLPPALQTMT